MFETFASLVSLLLAGGAVSVIFLSVWEDRVSLQAALVGAEVGAGPSLPPHTHRVAAPRRARFIQVAPARRLGVNEASRRFAA